jgi:hypothetical protein
MATQWVVLFDNEGLDTLIPWSELQEETVMSVLSGKPRVGPNPQHVVSNTLMRARLNTHRNTEVWAYNTSNDIDVDEMRHVWDESPQYMADLVRAKGENLFGKKSSKPPKIV